MASRLKCGHKGGGMKRTILAAIVAALTAASPASAQPLAAIGPSPMSCGGWDDTRERAAGYDSVAREQYDSWVEGFLSALEAMTGQHKLETTDADSIRTWMDNYCANNALQNLPYAAAVLWKQLQTAPAQ